MVRVMCAIGAALSIAGTTLAQTPPQSKQSDLVTVRGCLHGSEITSEGRRFRLTGDKRLMRELKAHEDHIEEVTGRLKDGTGNGGTHIKEWQTGKTHVYAGGGNAPVKSAADPDASSTLELRDFTHIQNKCTG